MVDACGIVSFRTLATEESYKKSYLRLCRQCGADVSVDRIVRLEAVTAWWRANSGAWRPATIRQYRAAILAEADAMSSSPRWTQDHKTKYANLSKESPLPRDRSAPRRTSAKKRRTVRENEIRKLAIAAGGARDRTGFILAGMLTYGASFGLRPCEWADARIVDGTLAIRSAKSTNGRGIENRFIETSILDPGAVARFILFLDVLHEEVGAHGWSKIYNRLAKRLYRLCLKLDIPVVCLYAVRHQALANAKSALDRVDVAALAGHVSVRTAATHYARRRNAWRPKPIPRPTPETRAAVRVTATVARCLRSTSLSISKAPRF